MYPLELEPEFDPAVLKYSLTVDFRLTLFSLAWLTRGPAATTDVEFEPAPPPHKVQTPCRLRVPLASCHAELMEMTERARWSQYSLALGGRRGLSVQVGGVPVSAAAWERRKSAVNNVTVLTRVDEAPATPSAASAAVVAIEPSDAPSHQATELEEAFEALTISSSEREAALRRRRLLASGSMHSIGPLEFGHNFLYVTVTSQDGDHQRQYTVEILRTEDRRELRLEALEFSQGAGSPAAAGAA